MAFSKFCASSVEPLQDLGLEDAEVRYQEAFFEKERADWLYEEFLRGIEWQQGQIKLFGNTVKIPRLQAFYADHGISYSYSGVELSGLPWTQALAELRDIASEVTGEPLNAALANLYRGGQDSMGWHSDDEPELGQDPTIVCFSFGATRRFRLRHREKSELSPVGIDLAHGSVLVMSGQTQQFWQHALPKTQKNIGPRISFTFRHVQEL